MNKRRKDKNKQIICIILFIFVLLSGVFYAVYTTVGKELLANENTNSSTNVIKTETDDKTTVSNEEEPNAEDDKPLTNKTTTDNKTSKPKPNKPSKPNNTTKPNANVVFDGYEVVHEKPNTSGDNTTGDNSSSSGSSTSRPKSTVAKVSNNVSASKKLSEGNYESLDSSLKITKNSSTEYSITGKIYVEDPNNITKPILAFISISAPEAYRSESILINGYYDIGAGHIPLEGAIDGTTIEYKPQLGTKGKGTKTISIFWGQGEVQKFTFTYDITYEKIEVETPDGNTTTEENN